MTITIDIAVIIIIAYLSFMGIAIKILMQRDKKIKLEKYKIDVEYAFDSKLEDQLNGIVESVFEEYRLYNLEYKDDSYIKEIDEKKIITDICEMVIQRMSPVFITRLSTYFNSENLGEIIATKISTKVMEYRVMRNIQGEQPKNKAMT